MAETSKARRTHLLTETNKARHAHLQGFANTFKNVRTANTVSWRGKNVQQTWHHTCKVEKKENPESSALCYLIVLKICWMWPDQFLYIYIYIYIFKAILNTEPVLTLNTAHRSLMWCLQAWTMLESLFCTGFHHKFEKSCECVLTTVSPEVTLCSLTGH